MYSDSILTRFWSYVTKEGYCWPWVGGKDPDGYGIFSVKGRSVRAHRLMYEHAFNVHLTSKEWVLHSCDNPSCVKPTHLFLGDGQINAYDRNKKGRQAKGETNAAAKVTKADVKAMRALALEMPISEIAKLFGLSRTHVWGIIKGKYWK